MTDSIHGSSQRLLQQDNREVSSNSLVKTPVDSLDLITPHSSERLSKGSSVGHVNLPPTLFQGFKAKLGRIWNKVRRDPVDIAVRTTGVLGGTAASVAGAHHAMFVAHMTLRSLGAWAMAPLAVIHGIIESMQIFRRYRAMQELNPDIKTREIVARVICEGVLPVVFGGLAAGFTIAAALAAAVMSGGVGVGVILPVVLKSAAIYTAIQKSSQLLMKTAMDKTFGTREESLPETIYHEFRGRPKEVASGYASLEPEASEDVGLYVGFSRGFHDPETSDETRTDIGEALQAFHKAASDEKNPPVLELRGLLDSVEERHRVLAGITVQRSLEPPVDNSTFPLPSSLSSNASEDEADAPALTPSSSFRIPETFLGHIKELSRQKELMEFNLAQLERNKTSFGSLKEFNAAKDACVNYLQAINGKLHEFRAKQIELLQARLDALIKENPGANELLEMREQLAGMLQGLAEATSQNDDLRRAQERLLDRLTAVGAELEQVKTGQAEFNLERDRAVEALKATIEKQKAEIQRLTHEASGNVQKRAELQLSLLQLRFRHQQNLRRLYLENESRMTVLRASLREGVQEQIGGLQTENSQLRGQLESARCDIESLQAKLQAQLSSSEDLGKNYQARLDALTRENTSHQETNRELQRKIAELEEDALQRQASFTRHQKEEEQRAEEAQRKLREAEAQAKAALDEKLRLEGDMQQQALQVRVETAKRTANERLAVLLKDKEAILRLEVGEAQFKTRFSIQELVLSRKVTKDEEFTDFGQALAEELTRIDAAIKQVIEARTKAITEATAKFGVLQSQALARLKTVGEKLKDLSEEQSSKLRTTLTQLTNLKLETDKKSSKDVTAALTALNTSLSTDKASALSKLEADVAQAVEQFGVSQLVADELTSAPRTPVAFQYEAPKGAEAYLPYVLTGLKIPGDQRQAAIDKCRELMEQSGLTEDQMIFVAGLYNLLEPNSALKEQAQGFLNQYISRSSKQLGKTPQTSSRYLVVLNTWVSEVGLPGPIKQMASRLQVRNAAAVMGESSDADSVKSAISQRSTSNNRKLSASSRNFAVISVDAAPYTLSSTPATPAPWANRIAGSKDNQIITRKEAEGHKIALERAWNSRPGGQPAVELKILTEAARAGQLSEEFLNRFPDRGLALLRDYVYPYQICEQRLAKKTDEEAKFFKEPASADDLLRNVAGNPPRNPVDVLLRAMQISAKLKTEGGLEGSPFSKTQADMFVKMRSALGSRPRPFHAEAGAGKSTMIRIFPSLFAEEMGSKPYVLHVSPFLEGKGGSMSSLPRTVDSSGATPIIAVSIEQLNDWLTRNPEGRLDGLVVLDEYDSYKYTDARVKLNARGIRPFETSATRSQDDIRAIIARNEAKMRYAQSQLSSASQLSGYIETNKRLNELSAQHAILLPDPQNNRQAIISIKRQMEALQNQAAGIYKKEAFIRWYQVHEGKDGVNKSNAGERYLQYLKSKREKRVAELNVELAKLTADQEGQFKRTGISIAAGKKVDDAIQQALSIDVRSIDKKSILVAFPEEHGIDSIAERFKQRITEKSALAYRNDKGEMVYLIGLNGNWPRPMQEEEFNKQAANLKTYCLYNKDSRGGDFKKHSNERVAAQVIFYPDVPLSDEYYQNLRRNRSDNYANTPVHILVAEPNASTDRVEFSKKAQEKQYVDNEKTIRLRAEQRVQESIRLQLLDEMLELGVLRGGKRWLEFAEVVNSLQIDPSQSGSSQELFRTSRNALIYEIMHRLSSNGYKIYRNLQSDALADEQARIQTKYKKTGENVYSREGVLGIIGQENPIFAECMKRLETGAFVGERLAYYDEQFAKLTSRPVSPDRSPGYLSDSSRGGTLPPKDQLAQTPRPGAAGTQKRTVSPSTGYRQPNTARGTGKIGN